MPGLRCPIRSKGSDNGVHALLSVGKSTVCSGSSPSIASNRSKHSSSSDGSSSIQSNTGMISLAVSFWLIVTMAASMDLRTSWKLAMMCAS